MADDIVVKIGDIDRAIRPHANVDRAKLAVAGLEHRIPPVELEAGTLRPQRKTLHGVGLEIVDHELAAHRLRHVAAVDHFDAAVAARVADAAESQPVLGWDGGRGQVGHPAGSVDHERLAPVIEHHAPRIARPHKIVQQSVQLQPARAQAVHAGLIQRRHAPRRLHARLDAIALTEK